jgi:hypothetical protein
MSSEIYLILFLLFFVLLPGAIVLMSLGDKFKNRIMFAWGVALTCTTIIGIIVAGFFTGLLFVYVLAYPIVLVILVALAIVWFVYSIHLIIAGFKEHKSGTVTLGFSFIGFIFTVIVAPVVLISIFGLPISFM